MSQRRDVVGRRRTTIIKDARLIERELTEISRINPDRIQSAFYVSALKHAHERRSINAVCDIRNCR
jgi:hypothetical protein